MSIAQGVGRWGVARAGAGAPSVEARRAWVAEVYRHHGTAVHAVASALCGPALADDVTRAVFALLWRQPERFEPDGCTLGAHLVALARSEALGKQVTEPGGGGREPRQQDASAHAVGGGQSGPADDPADVAPVVAALRSLPEGERSAVVVACYGRCTHREAAWILDQPEGAIRSAIRSGLRHLAAALAEPSA